MSGLFKNFKTVKAKVKWLLEKDERTRDKDELLIATYWYYELGSDDRMLVKDFLRDYSQGKFTSAETIRRVRQKLQEEVVALRGHNFKYRKSKAMLDAQAQIKIQNSYAKEDR